MKSKHVKSDNRMWAVTGRALIFFPKGRGSSQWVSGSQGMMHNQDLFHALQGCACLVSIPLQVFWLCQLFSTYAWNFISEDRRNCLIITLSKSPLNSVFPKTFIQTQLSTICMVTRPQLSRPSCHHAGILDHLRTYTDKPDLEMHEMFLTVISKNPQKQL